MNRPVATGVVSASLAMLVTAGACLLTRPASTSSGRPERIATPEEVRAQIPGDMTSPPRFAWPMNLRSHRTAGAE
ncbi:MAG TPA: hypothetical protein VLH79_10015 [Chthonomonadales bacterium]|nr:hypothetical protein [Chthonomonadales bacterium]